MFFTRKVHISPELLQRELEVIGRLEVAIKAEIGDLRDRVIHLTNAVAEANARADRMADRLIEMSMVQRGACTEASSAVRYRQLSQPAPTNSPGFQSTDGWGDPESDDDDDDGLDWHPVVMN